jgi:ribulose-phosphate 3-epimerase
LNKFKEFYVSAISGNPRDLFNQLDLCEKHGLTGVHIDVMDGNFVPRFGLHMELIAEIIQSTGLLTEIHLMSVNTEAQLPQILNLGVNRVIVHVEAVSHPHRILSEIKSYGVESGIALNPGTPLESLDYLSDVFDLVLLMAINPGVPKHSMIESTFTKISQLKKKMVNGFEGKKISIDGGVSFSNMSDLYKEGADVLIGGSGTIFSSSGTIEENLRRVVELLKS